MSQIKYDEQGGIVSLDKTAKESKSKTKTKAKAGYNFWEKLLIKKSRRINYLLDDKGKYKCRRQRTPSIIRIGPTNRCTAQCFYCPREHIAAHGSGYMEAEMFAQILTWAKKNAVEAISFALFGEPLLHPDILAMMQAVKNAGMGVRISTNAIILSPKLAEDIIDLDLDALEASLDGYNEDEYERGKQVSMFSRAKENIEYLLKKAKEKKSSTVFNIHFVDAGNVSSENKRKFVAYWRKQLQGLKYETSFYYEPHNWAGTRPLVAKDMGLLDKILAKLELKKPCVYIKGLNIDWNGDVYICTNDPTDKAIIGNIKKNSIEEIYNGEKRIAFLSAHESGNYQGLNCQVCTVNSYWPFLFIKKRIINYLSRKK